ncbi:hypothetical protein DICPUDRAFT_77228 [Dictyostelium purpureum]|uniref:Uncharacterized protein n=1 Tax=Dictyostelium purpureum TaxID=5786 RepID=F0ZFZ7_DICPU|nr:uncharacterized protein DICPUDRAFT_77228 [Dictyostelium purpureum]EGC37127.1 hypothetical protein DICPUDRAFT_77228 [Dictyostelium purpureum]|eukprot:XP_003286330.1 hypothetical protein DICPUDRAFT_77228 [Dictyostelium purpureum]
MILMVHEFYFIAIIKSIIKITFKNIFCQRKKNIKFFIFLILLLTTTSESFLFSGKIKSVDKFSDTLKEISKSLPTNINHGFNRISLLIPELSNAFESQELDTVALKDKIISVIESTEKLMDGSINSIGKERMAVFEESKKLILILKESLVESQFQTIDYMEERFNKGIDKALKESEKWQNLTDKFLNEIGQDIHWFLEGLNTFKKLFFTVGFIVVALVLTISIKIEKKNDDHNIKFFVFIFSVILHIILTIYTKIDILILFSIALLPFILLIFINRGVTLIVFLSFFVVVPSIMSTIYPHSLSKIYDSIISGEDPFRATVCPMVSFQLIDIRDDNVIIIPESAANIFKKLPSPIYSYSEIGDYSTHKSTRLDLYTMMLFKQEIKDNCDLDLFQVKTIKTSANEGKCVGSRGCTRGIWAQIIKISDIDTENLSPRLKSAIKKLDSKGTIVLLDSEGSNDPDGMTAGHLNVVQTILMSITSSFSYTEHLQINEYLINKLALLSSFLESLYRFKNSLDECSTNEKAYTNGISSKKWTDFPKINLIFSNSANLALELNLNFDNKTELINSLDTTKLLYSYLNEVNFKKEDKYKESIQTIKRVWGDGAKSSVVLTATRNEVKFFLEEFSYAVDIPDELTYSSEAGAIYSISNQVLPMVINSLSSKIYMGKEANGADILKIIEESKGVIFKSISASAFSSYSSSDFSNLVEEQVNQFTNNWIQETRNQVTPQLPIETSNQECYESSSNRCEPSKLDERLKPYLKSLNVGICTLIAGSPNNDKTNQIVNKIKSDTQPLLEELHQKNQNLCKFRWVEGQWGPCDGHCLLNRKREIHCALDSKPNQPRKDVCCDGNKPHNIESCGKRSYHWAYQNWGECSGECGVQYRRVDCIACDGTISDSSMCSNIPKEIDSQSCNPKFTWETSEWRNVGGCRRGGKFRTGTEKCDFERDIYCKKCGVNAPIYVCDGLAGEKPSTRKRD